MENANTNILERKTGIVALVGRSNVGKSTLLNALVGTKLAITSPKPQTTRQPVHGILTEPRGQIVFVDTPGLFLDARDTLSKQLAQAVHESVRDVDAIVYVADPTRPIGTEERALLALVRNVTVPKILVLNKSDITREPQKQAYRELGSEFTSVLEISTKEHDQLRELVDVLFTHLPVGPFLYPEGQLTNMPTEIWLAELIREKLFLRLRQEVPYSIHVVVDEVDRRENGTMYIRARILTAAERYQRMIIGRGGHGVKEIGQSARRELEAVMQCPIYLDLEVETDPHWISWVTG